MKTYNWTMSVSDAEALRERKQKLGAEVQELANQWAEAATRSEKAAITCQRNTIEAEVAQIAEQLKGAPPKPINEADVVAEMLELLGEYEANYTRLQAEFIEKVADNPAEAIRWNAQSLLVAQEMYSLVDRVMARKVEWSLEEIISALEEIKETAEREASYFDPLSGSTCAFSNVVSAAKYVAYSRMISKAGMGSVEDLLKRIEWRAEAVAAWRQLQ